MSANNTPHHILHRMVPLICQALTTAPSDQAVWLNGLRLLASPKLCQAMSLTSSIWLPLLLRSLETTRPTPVILAGLRVLAEVAETLEPMKSCLVKPLRLLGVREDVCDSEELTRACQRLRLIVWDKEKREIGKVQELTIAGISSSVATPVPTPVVSPRSSAPLPQPAQTPSQPRDHPLLAEILERNLPSKPRTVRQAWSMTLLAPTHDNSTVWMHNLFAATVEACQVPEMLITSRLGPNVHQELFQTAFLKCYALIEGDSFKDTVDTTLIRLLSDKSLATEISILLLDLVAFFDKEKCKFPAAVGEAAKKCALENFQGDLNHAVPGIVLWYAEQEMQDDLTAANIANLVEINIRVGSAGYDSAWSSLLWLRDDYEVKPDPMWITHLSHWQTALDAQEALDEGNQGTTFESFNTKMICYHALGLFDQGYQLAQNLFEGLNDHERRKTAHWATASAWHVGDYEAMADYLAFHPKGTSKSLYKAIIDVHSEEYGSAFHHIAKAQSLSYDELQTQLGIGPSVALKSLAKTEMLVELQEVIQFKSQPDLRDEILQTWRARFKRSHADANTWLKRLQLWTLACPTTTRELQHCYLETAKLCESSGMHEAAEGIIRMVTPPIHPPGCKVEYTRLRFQWKDATDKNDPGQLRALLDKLHYHTSDFIDHLGMDRLALEATGLGLRPLEGGADTQTKYDRNVLARRYYRLGQWTETLQGSEWVTDPNSEVFRYYSLAYKLDKTWYTGSWSISQAAMSIFEGGGHSRTDHVAVNSYVVPAIRGLFQATRSRETPEKMIKALLRLVTLWFRYGESDCVLREVESQLVQTPVTSWIHAIPQLIARLGTQHKDLQGTLIVLLKDIAGHFPHAVIWPLLTASQTKKVEHQEAARVIMDYICTMADGTRLVAQAELVGRELIRTSISWMEKWRNLIDRVLPRQELMETAWHEIPVMWEDEVLKLQHPETPDEEQFVQQYGHAIVEVYNSLLKYRSNRQVTLVNAAYTELYKLYGEIETTLGQWKQPSSKLQLASTAPKLLTLRDCILTVPGQYDPNLKLDDQAFIDTIHPSVDILASKQLPRKLVIRSYTNDYTFLLKGNEDLRGDERIMQLFTLINTLLNHESEAFGRNLHLLPYEVIPLSPSAGLVSWVPNTQQLQAMIQANRDRNKRNDLSNKELASLLGYDPATFDSKQHRHRLDPPAESERYDKLPLDVKVQRLKAALSHSNQSDLKEVLWQRSPAADIWLRRRTNFARTVGVGSFVGHIIGLGDRHGSNILVDQLTWGALHIDFGDLFGAAQERALMPEKVPFRLTRMMTNAFELACYRGHDTPGSRGSFKQASIVTMNVLRESRSSLLAMLEAFLYDPLLSWTANASPSAAQASEQPTTAKENTITGAATLHVGRKPDQPTHAVPQSVAPLPAASGAGAENSDVYNRIDNSLIAAYLDTDSYMAKVSGSGMTNAKALQVLAQIERKLAGYHESSETPLPVKKQVQELIEEATDLRNLCQGYVLGWAPHW